MAVPATAPPQRPLSPSAPDVDAFHALEPEQRIAAVRASANRPGVAEQVRITLMLGRPRTCVPMLLAYTLGWVTVGGTLSWLFALGLFMILICGLLTNLYNAYTDLEEDSRNLPGRVLLLLRLGHRRSLWIAHTMAKVVLALAVVYSPGYCAAVAVFLVGAHQYSFRPLRLKARPALGLLAFSLAVFGPFLLGCLSAPRGMRVPTPAAWALFAFLIVWFCAKGMVKNLPDYDGDRAAGLRTSATVFPTRRSAAHAATAATVVGYLSLAVFVPAGGLPTRLLLTLPWVVLAARQCVAMLRATQPGAANKVLKQDMLLSSAFLATLLLLESPGAAAIVAVAVSAAVLFGSDLVALDSRRAEDHRRDFERQAS
jgi:4-hydroxybenzoate polyprenyltransferase